MIEQIPIRIVSHDPIPLTMLPAASVPIMAVRWRDDGSTVVPLDGWTLGQGRDLWSIVLRQRMVAINHLAGPIDAGD